MRPPTAVMDSTAVQALEHHERTGEPPLILYSDDKGTRVRPATLRGMMSRDLVEYVERDGRDHTGAKRGHHVLTARGVERARYVRMNRAATQAPEAPDEPQRDMPTVTADSNGWKIDGAPVERDYRAARDVLITRYRQPLQQACAALDDAQLLWLNAMASPQERFARDEQFGGFVFECGASGACVRSGGHDSPDGAALAARMHQLHQQCVSVQGGGSGREPMQGRAISHHGQGLGMSPEHAQDPAARAAAEVLDRAGLRLATLLGEYDPQTSTATGYMVVPRGADEDKDEWVYVYYLTEGRTHDPATGRFPHQELRRASTALFDQGWGVDPLPMKCVRAHTAPASELVLQHDYSAVMEMVSRVEARGREATQE